MKICTIDSSGLVAGVAVSDNGICIAEYNIQYKVTHSQTLLPMLDEVCKRVALDPGDMDAFAVAAGPGSFTGLRIGVATVKGLTLVHDRPVVAVPTLEALAYNAYGIDRLICPIMDARREQVYTGIYAFDRVGQDMNGGAQPSGKSMLRCILPQSAMAFDELCERLNGFGKSVMFIGDGIPVFESAMSGLLKIDYETAPIHMNRQRAASLASLADHYLSTDHELLIESGLEGVITDGQNLTPVYLRESQAEREKKSRTDVNDDSDKTDST